MSDRKPVHESEHVACRICLKQVPRSVAQSPEGTEYVYYFCGADCYEKWQAEAGQGSETRKK